jgi:hypothetical protein
MKRSLLILIGSCIGISSFAQSQLPNPGFEDWSLAEDNKTLYPTNWQEPDLCANIEQGEVVCASTVKRTNSAAEGNYAAEIFTIVIGDNVNYGSFSNLNDLNGVNFTERPTNLTFKVKFHTTAGNKLNVRNILYTTTSNLLEDIAVVATIDKVYSASELSETEFVKVSIPLTYFSTDAPEYSFINISFENKPTVGGEYFVLDDFKYEYDTPTATTDSKNLLATKLLNVSQNELTLSAECQSIAIYTVQGHKVAEIEHSDVLDISSLPVSTIYLLKAVNANGILSTKFAK